MLHGCPTAALTVELRARRAGLLRETLTVIEAPREAERSKVLARGFRYAVVGARAADCVVARRRWDSMSGGARSILVGRLTVDQFQDRVRAGRLVPL
jgi:hypothetical protein